MLQLAKDLQIFHPTRHKGAQGPFFHFFLAAVRALCLRQHRSSAVPRRLALILSLWHCYDIKHGGCIYHAADMPAWIQHASFCLTALEAVVDARRTVDLFSWFGHIVSDGNYRSTCTSGLFCLCLGGSSSQILVFPAPHRHHLRAQKIFAQASSSDL